MNASKASLALALTTALGTTGMAVAAENPFAMQVLSQGYMVADAGKKEGGGKTAEGKCGEGKCAASREESRAAEGKCGEGKCGAGREKARAAEGKCGEGKCGGSQ